MAELLNALWQLVQAIADIVVSLGAIVLPWTPFIAWFAFWMFAVNWSTLRVVLARGGWVGLLILAGVAVLVWGSIAPPPEGHYSLTGLTLSNYVGKTVFVTALICLMFFAGSLQLSGCCASCCHFEEPAGADDEHGHGDHGHGHDAQHAVAAAHH